MAKLTDFETPTGQKGNLLSIDSWLKMILGGVVMIVSFATAQNVAKTLGSKVPFVDTQIDKPYKDHPVVTNVSKKRMV